MKCTNNQINKPCFRRFCALFLCSAVLLTTAAGCGKTPIALEQPYDVYGMTAAAGAAGTSSAAEKTYFSADLCVADNITIGTDTTDAQVAEGAAAFNLATNEVLYSKNMYARLYPASTTKILTAYLTLKYCEDLDQKVTVSAHAADQASDSSVCGLAAGDVLTVRDLLYGLMLRSGNDAAIALAETISGSEEAFADLMNEEARKLGAVQSHFVNSNGLPDENHYTTVYDLYLLFQAALQNDLFTEIISTTSYTVSYKDSSGTEQEHVWENTNQYLSGHYKTPEGFEIIGGKTGTTGQAGYCLVLYSKNPAGEPIISIVLKADGKSNLYLLMNEMLSGFAKN